MARRRHTPDQVNTKLTETDAAIAAGSAAAVAARRIGVTGHTFYPWRSDCGGPGLDQARRLRPLKSENSRPQRAAADLTLDNRILWVASGILLSPSLRRRCVDSACNAAISQPSRGHDDAPTSCPYHIGLE